MKKALKNNKKQALKIIKTKKKQNINRSKLPKNIKKIISALIAPKNKNKNNKLKKTEMVPVFNSNLMEPKKKSAKVSKKNIKKIPKDEFDQIVKILDSEECDLNKTISDIEIEPFKTLRQKFDYEKLKSPLEKAAFLYLNCIKDISEIDRAENMYNFDYLDTLDFYEKLSSKLNLEVNVESMSDCLFVHKKVQNFEMLFKNEHVDLNLHEGMNAIEKEMKNEFYVQKNFFEYNLLPLKPNHFIERKTPEYVFMQHFIKDVVKKIEKILKSYINSPSMKENEDIILDSIISMILDFLKDIYTMSPELWSDIHLKRFEQLSLTSVRQNNFNYAKCIVPKEMPSSFEIGKISARDLAMVERLNGRECSVCLEYHLNLQSSLIHTCRICNRYICEYGRSEIIRYSVDGFVTCPSCRSRNSLYTERGTNIMNFTGARQNIYGMSKNKSFAEFIKKYENLDRDIIWRFNLSLNN